MSFPPCGGQSPNELTSKCDNGPQKARSSSQGESAPQLRLSRPAASPCASTPHLRPGTSWHHDFVRALIVLTLVLSLFASGCGSTSHHRDTSRIVRSALITTLIRHDKECSLYGLARKLQALPPPSFVSPLAGVDCWHRIRVCFDMHVATSAQTDRAARPRQVWQFSIWRGKAVGWQPACFAIPAREPARADYIRDRINPCPQAGQVT
jgi:hypothetical protein